MHQAIPKGHYEAVGAVFLIMMTSLTADMDIGESAYKLGLWLKADARQHYSQPAQPDIGLFPASLTPAIMPNSKYLKYRNKLDDGCNCNCIMATSAIRISLEKGLLIGHVRSRKRFPPSRSLISSWIEAVKILG